MPIKKVLIVIGTRPEAIKMAPLVLRMSESAHFDLRVCVTAQHRQMLDSILEIFKITPHYDLNIMGHAQTLEQVHSMVLAKITPVLQELRPDLVLVHGDTATTFAATLASYYNHIPVGHVEAGLRTGNLYSPWPEEANRRLTAAIAKYHFAPTEIARQNLIKENIDEKDIFVTGNTVIDALHWVKNKLDESPHLIESLNKKFSMLDNQKKLILVTGHRRENFGSGFERICVALQKIASEHPDCQIVYPVHLNPNVKVPVQRLLADIENIYLIAPQDYVSFSYLLMRSHIILTDSGGIQEEAPSLGKPVLVMRDTSERMEGVLAGTVKLVGTDIGSITRGVSDLLNKTEVYNKASKAKNPYGTGNAASIICAILGDIR